MLEYSDFISKELFYIEDEDKRKEYRLVVKDKDSLPKVDKPFILPSRLPMVCLPKPYSNELKGGYLLNDDKYEESLLIDKHAYKLQSIIDKDSSIFDMVNNIASTPFKINKDVLEYINTKGEEQNLIIDIGVEYELEKLTDLKPSQKRKLASYNSKKVLQETILGLAEFYSNLDKFYFPVRIDQRG